MRRRTHGVVLIVLVLALLVPTSAGLARQGPNLPIDLEGTLKGAPYRIVVPANWNGTLLVYVRGYSADPTGMPDAAFKAEDELLARGYALAASGLRGGGSRVDEFTLDVKYLTDFFKQKVGKPDHTIIYGVSMGGDITLLSMEKFPGTYDAGIPLCAGGAGLIRDVAERFSFALAYDAAFGWDDSWGQVEDLRDDLEFYEEVWWPKVFPELFGVDGTEYPANFARWEFVRLANGLPLPGYYTNPFPWEMPPGVVALMFFSTAQRVELEAMAGGRVSQNVGYVYALSQDERDYLLYLDPTLNLDAMLAQMNGMTGITAEPRALAQLRRIGEYSGRVHGPILMGHNTQDVITAVEHTTEYANLMASVGTLDLLTRVYAEQPGHCMFTDAQLLAMFDAMDTWLETGVAPGPEAFPEDLGFAHDFEPGPWPQPPQN